MPSLSYFGGQLFKAPSTAIILRLKNSELPQNHHSPPLHNLFTLPSEGVGTGIVVVLHILGKSWTWVRTEIFSPAIRRALKWINVFLFLWWVTTLCIRVLMHSKPHWELEWVDFHSFDGIIVNWVEWLWNPSDSFVICFCGPESAQRSKEFLSFWLYWPIKTLH